MAVADPSIPHPMMGTADEVEINLEYKGNYKFC